MPVSGPHIQELDKKQWKKLLFSAKIYSQLRKKWIESTKISSQDTGHWEKQETNEVRSQWPQMTAKWKFPGSQTSRCWERAEPGARYKSWPRMQSCKCGDAKVTVVSQLDVRGHAVLMVYSVFLGALTSVLVRCSLVSSRLRQVKAHRVSNCHRPARWNDGQTQKCVYFERPPYAL